MAGDNTPKSFEGLIPIFAKAAIGDFSEDPVVPAEDNEVVEIYMGVKVMLDVIREKLAELEKLNSELQKKVKEQEATIESLVGRELRMVELKQELEKLQQQVKLTSEQVKQEEPVKSA